MYGPYLKRIITTILCFCLMISLCACGSTGTASSETSIPPKPESVSQPAEKDVQTSSTVSQVQSEIVSFSAPVSPEQTESSYVELIKFLQSNDYLCAVAFIGHASGPKWEGTYFGIYGDQGHLVDYPFISQIPDERFVESEGEELYCIVPADPNASVAVNQWIIPEGSGQEGHVGEVLYRSESGEPILLRGNADPFASNLQVNITDESGQTVTFYPMTNPMDGTLLLPELDGMVWDFTLYDGPLYGGPIDTVVSLTMEELLGDWSVWGLVDEDGTPISCHLSFRSDYYGGDDMEFLVCDENGNVIRRYEGAYYGPDDAHQEPTPELMRFDMWLTEGEGSDEMPPPMIAGMFSIFPAPSPDEIVIAHQEGDPLLVGMENSWIGFFRAMG